MDKKKLYGVIFTLAIISWYILNRFFALAEYYSPTNPVFGVSEAINNSEYMFFEVLPSFNVMVNLLALMPIVAVGILVSIFAKPKKFRNNIEHGSARWGSKKDISRFENKSKKKI